MVRAGFGLAGGLGVSEKDGGGEAGGGGVGSKRPRLIRPARQPGHKAQRAADDDRQVALARDAEGGEPAREILGGDAFSPPSVHGDEVGAGRDAFGDAVLFGGDDLLRGAAVYLLLDHPDALDRGGGGGAGSGEDN